VCRKGDVSNNGTSDNHYVTSIANHTTVPGAGFFQNGATSGTSYADFDSSYRPINGSNFQSTATRYAVQDGDTPQSIAQTVWGDSSFWYVIATTSGELGSAGERVARYVDLVGRGSQVYVALLPQHGYLARSKQHDLNHPLNRIDLFVPR
jgi:hypothetical protein